MNIENLLEKLKKKSPHLAQIFTNCWEMPLADYSRRLYSPKSVSLELELVTSFQEEWVSMGLVPEKIKRASRQLTELSVLQTSHHVTPTNGPGFLSLDLITLSGLPDCALYLVAANSGVAFSNSAWTGALSYGSTRLNSILIEGSASYHQAKKSAKERKGHGERDQRITLIPSRQRDQLVFGTKVSGSHIKIIDHLTSPMKPLVDSMVEGELYSRWAIKSCNLIQNRIFDTERILYFDINQVLKRYLLKVLKNEAHPVSQLIFQRHDIWQKFAYPPLFLKNYKGKKSNKVDTLIWSTKGLISKKTGSHLNTCEDIILALEENRYCPALFLLFFVLRFLNGIKCLGSFNQIEYLERFRQNWLGIENEWKLDLEEDWRQSLTTGRWIKDGLYQWSLDAYLRNESINIQDYSQLPMRYFWTPVLEQLTD